MMHRLKHTVVAAAAITPLLFAGIAQAQPAAEPTADFSIVNGQVANPNAAPAFIQLLEVDYDDGRVEIEHQCGASLIAGDWILTAANCLWNDDRGYTPKAAHKFKATHPQTGEIRDIDRIIFPDNLRQTGWPADIALVHVSRPFSTDARMTLAAQNPTPPTSGTATVWGKGDSVRVGRDDFELDSRDFRRSQLRRADVPLHPANVCSTNGLFNGMICAEAISHNNSAPGTCEGDDGGPLTLNANDPRKMVQIGVVSDVDELKDDDHCGSRPMFYTNVGTWANWIASVVPGVKFSGAAAPAPSQPAPSKPAPQQPAPQQPAPQQPAPQQPSAPTQPGANPSPASLNCGAVNSPGSARPQGDSPNLSWAPVRGKDSGSTVSVTASQLTWNPTHDNDADYAILAGECAWADALAATTLTDEGPLLLTNPNTLEAEVKNELGRLRVRRVLIVGGPAAVSPAVEAELNRAGMQVTRLQGPSRVGTAAVVADFASRHDDDDDGVVVARAYPNKGGTPSQAFADSLAAAYYAPWTDSPILLSASNALSGESANYLRSHRPESVTLMGGAEALHQGMEGEIARLVPPRTPISRVAGASRADTAAKLGRAMLDRRDDRARGVLVIDGQDDDAWKVGFTFSSLAEETKSVYALAAGDNIAPESAALIKEAKRRGLPIRCVANTAACTKAQSL